MAYTHSLIASSTVGAGGVSAITFNNIPQNYTDLCFKISARITRSGYPTDLMNVSFNGTSNNESSKRLEGSGSGSATAGSNSLLLAYSASTSSATSNTFGNAEFYISNYASSNYKSAYNDGVSETNASTAYMGMATNLWSNTSPIVSVAFTPDSGTAFEQHTTIYLYGIRVEL
jgi:hypothetical protein